MVRLNSEFNLRDQGVSNALGIESLARHRWYFVKEGFSPTLVNKAIEIEGVLPGELLVDPFSGSGTAPLTAALAGLSSNAFEINPFLRFLSTTKLLNGSSRSLKKAGSGVLRALTNPVRSPLEGFSTFTKGNRWDRWLFRTSVLRSFEAGRLALAAVPDQYRALLKLALLGAAMDSCNAQRDGKCLRYPKDWSKHQSTATTLQARFESRLRIMAEDLSSAPLKDVRTSVLEGDARQLVSRLTDKFRLCVTSPPYLNSFDYSDVYRPELFLGGFVDSNKHLMTIRLKTIRSHVQANWESPKKDRFGALYKNCVTRIRGRAGDLWDRRLPTMIQAYFEDMDIVLRGLRKAAKDNASLWLVVSTSAYAGVEVPVDLILADIGQQAGWFLREVGILRYLRSSSQHVQHVEDNDRKSVPLRESVVIFDASPESAPPKAAQKRKN